jgi:secreted PhoX family phosphatase
MSQHSHSTRRRFLGQAGAAALGLSPLAQLLAAAGGDRGKAIADAGYGPLRAVRDSASGLPLLRLPAGFSYVSFGWAGEALADGKPCPSAHDGMGVVAADGQRLTLVRNHEVTRMDGVIGVDAPTYEAPCSGGTTTLLFDAERGELVEARASLAGTLTNCAGGVTPWGSWLSCEEIVINAARPQQGARVAPSRDHGFVFEVPAHAAASAQPLRAMGQFRHEAVAVHRSSGALYLTEDLEPSAGFYRFLPKVPGKLAEGGQLQMLRADGRTELRSGLRLGESLPCSWVDIARPEEGFSESGSINGVHEQGLALGGSRFTRLEGCIASEQEIFFTATNGGDAACGQVFAYRPASSELRLVYESTDPDVLDYPDNVVLSPRGGLVICQDAKRSRQRLFGLTQGHELFPFAEHNVVLDGTRGFSGDFRSAEWAGACFSPDGRWLFANIYSPGLTVAITGPWRDGLI